MVANRRGGRYHPQNIPIPIFTPEQLRYLREELQKISGAINGLDDGYSARWDDWKFPFTQSKTGSNLKPDFDETNVGFLFPQNDATEIIRGNDIVAHGYINGTNLRPHIHWDQTSSSFPTWKLDYKWYNAGELVPASFTTIEVSTGVFSYVSGTLSQISKFPEIDGTGMKHGSTMLIKVYRDDNVVTGDVRAQQFDFHFQSNKPGTRKEFIDALY